MEEELTITKEIEEALPPEAIGILKGEGYHLTKSIAAIKVTNEEAYKEAVELGTANKKVLNQIETFRKAIVKPFNDQIKRINDMFKTLAARFAGNDEKIRAAIERYQAGRKQTETIQNVQTGTGRATIQERWAYEILDGDLVPREWCCPDETKIGREVRAGLRQELPGLKI